MRGRIGSDVGAVLGLTGPEHRLGVDDPRKDTAARRTLFLKCQAGLSRSDRLPVVAEIAVTVGGLVRELAGVEVRDPWRDLWVGSAERRL
ncbi:hypothetical protein KGQ19_37270 [Catenulispora sp. NL8]|uniref:Uncharacterized protein n=1 Tax=Catenulispora pinistramenti TaxID=2705254 RepID=A0ABS5L2F5_9ACTN|nr:hypothetical protein [Catenulispora pinistramenti]MBS2552521.1 hypothetical protein [Catenulispora pinistramenti]